MATIKKIDGKKGPAFKITVTLGRDQTGKQIRHFMTWRPDEPMTAKQAEKRAKQVAVEFEKSLETGFRADLKETFSEYAEHVLRAKEMQGISLGTIQVYRRSLKKWAYPAIGNMKIRDIRPKHLTDLYQEISGPGLKTREKRAIPKKELLDALDGLTVTQKAMAHEIGMDESLITKCKKPGQKIKSESAERIAAYFKRPIKDLFEIIGEDARISNETIRTVHRQIHAILEFAVKEMVLQINPADRAIVPRCEPKEPNYLQPEEITDILTALEREDLKWKTLVHTLIFSGIRRGELLALRWSKINFQDKTICVDRALKMDEATRDLYEDKTKTGNIRYIPLPDATITLLRKYRAVQSENRLLLGDLWEPGDYVFTNETGRPIRPNTVAAWLDRFAKRNGFRHINPHSFRHSFASIMLSSGVDPLTVSKLMGHKKTSMTLDTYGHGIEGTKRNAVERYQATLLRDQPRKNELSEEETGKTLAK